jgi:hypothetical protein
VAYYNISRALNFDKLRVQAVTFVRNHVGLWLNCICSLAYDVFAIKFYVTSVDSILACDKGIAIVGAQIAVEHTYACLGCHWSETFVVGHGTAASFYH